jgi:hypothetical protein
MDKEIFRKKLVAKTGCEIQHTGYPCNTCFHAMNIKGLKHDIHDYWVAVLAHRGDYPQLKKRPELIKELDRKLSARKKLKKVV